MLEGIKGIIFDLDGTLIDSMWLWKQIDIDYLAKHHIDLPDDLQDQIEGMSFTETAAYFKKRFKLADSIESIKNDWNEMAGVYYQEKVTLKKDTKKLLEHLKQAGFKVGIATSNSPELVESIIKRFDLRQYFDAIRTSCQVENGKPAPDVYLKVAQDLKLNPKSCLVFEDVKNGVQAGLNAGMKVCAVYDDFSKEVREELENLAHYYIEDFSAVVTCFYQ